MNMDHESEMVIPAHVGPVLASCRD
jgi:hypothetical protein